MMSPDRRRPVSQHRVWLLIAAACIVPPPQEKRRYDQRHRSHDPCAGRARHRGAVRSIGFTLVGANEDCGEMDWARLTPGNGEVMFSAAGRPSDSPRREVDVYIRTDNVQAMHARLKDGLEIAEDLHDTFYGMREFIIRDCNGFWITFGQLVPTAPRDCAA